MTTETDRIVAAIKSLMGDACDAALHAAAKVIAGARMSVLDRVLWWSGLAFWLVVPLAVGIAIGRVM